MKKSPLIWGIVLVLFLALPAFAAPIGMTFEGLQDQEPVLEYYNGGFGGGSYGFGIDPSGPGPNYGVSFDSNALTLISMNAGGSGNFMNAPSGSTALFSLASSYTMDVAAGFNSGLAFYYSAAAAGTVDVWSGLDGTGTKLATIALPAMSEVIDNGSFDTWAPIGAGFNGIAESVVFSSANAIGFDNITLGSTTPVPVPPSVWLLGSSLLGLAGFRKKFSR